MAVRSGR